MAQVSLIRIDTRLIHGQVITQWIKQCKAKRIIVIDNAIVKDPMMCKIFEMAVPAGIKLKNLSVDQAADWWKNDQFGPVGPVMVLFRDVPSAHETFVKGFDYKELQIGGIGGGAGRKQVHGPVTLNESDAKLLQEIAAGGVEIVMQSTMDEPIAKWSDIKAKYFPNI